MIYTLENLLPLKGIDEIALELEKVLLENFETAPVFSKEQIKKALLSEGAIFFFWVKEGEIIGFCSGTVVCETSDLEFLVVEKTQRRKGIGAALLRAFLEFLAHKQAQVCFLEVRESNELAQKLYEEQGFEFLIKRENYYQNPKEDALVYRKKT